MNENLKGVGELYRYALGVAGVKPVYSSSLKSPGVLICPTRYPHATLYMVSSESDETAVSFKDEATQKEFAGHLAPGRAALLLVGENGSLITSYNWQ